MSDRGYVRQFVTRLEQTIKEQFGVCPTSRTRRILDREASRLGADYCEDFGQLILLECLTAPPVSDSDLVRTVRRVRQRLYREVQRERERRSDLSDEIPEFADPVDAAAIREVIGGLGDKDFILLFDRLSAGRSVEEIAAELGVSRRTVYRRLTDLRKHFHNLF